jgi:putative endonuclease
MPPKVYYVYILASASRVLYGGVTNDLFRRIWQHKQRAVRGFTSRYNVVQMVHFEETNSAIAAIAREKEIKGWRRERKMELVEQGNPAWADLSAEWYEGKPGTDPSLRSG